MDQPQNIQPTIVPISQQNQSLTEYLFFAIKVALILIIFLYFLGRKKRDLKKTQIKQTIVVPLTKIIVALQINDFFVHIQNKLQNGYEPLQLSNSQTNVVWKSIQKLFGYKLCFKPLYPQREILTFVKGLKNINKICLMLYTSLNPEVTDSILKKLRLSEYFPPENRKFCDPKQIDTMKHAIDVDKQSRRVVIVTPCKKDHNWQDQQYFLVQNPKGGKNKNFLKDVLRTIKDLVEKNESLDTLHDELAQVKIDVEESDMDMSDVERQIQ